ncbi:unnamed protein product [Schistocephalus solidus]|uniref:G_PROTEIN_RECEP_F1_2 domain-containing protein n=1 Tax=Schistocephalus solidus TaxID=70667 RepID=A0A183SMG7_SCHSO|nr:unnamed protein product [Schistocephalus solidus]
MPHVAQTASHSNCLFESDSSDFSHAVGAFRAYASPIIAIAGLIGSLLIIIVFAKEKPRTRFSIFAISLAIAHSMSLILNTVMDDFLGRGLQFATGNQFTLKLDSTSTLACKLMEYFPNAMYFAASYLMVTFSLDRALTINRPLQFNSFFYRKYATLTCILVFVVGFLGNLPFLLIQKLQFNSAIPTNYTCVMNQDYPKMAKFAIVFSTLVTFFLPVLIIFALNIVIVTRLWQIHRWRRGQLKIKTRIVSELGRATGHLAMSTAFLLLYVPLGFVVLVRLHFTEVHGDDTSAAALRIIDLSRFFSSLKDLAYAVNVLIYAVFLKNFRTRLLRLLSCQRNDNSLNCHAPRTEKCLQNASAPDVCS